MGYTEYHIGKVKQVDLQGKSIEEVCQEICMSRGFTKLGHYDDWFELLSDNVEDTYFISKNRLFESIEHKELNENFDVFTENPDGTFSYITSFYNGGCSLSEVIEEHLEKIK